MPITIDGAIFYMSFYERERISETVNVIPILIDAKRESNGNNRLLEDLYSSRKGNWYIVITVHDYKLKDCLKNNHPSGEAVSNFLMALKNEYLGTQNYYEAYFKM